MKGLRKFLTPFAPDQSGAVSVLYEMGGILVICDAGGCVGNVCGFDEPRWFSQRSAIFSAGLRDMDAILGRDDRLVAKLADAAQKLDAKFAAIIGTPVPAVIGTDYHALRRLAEKKINLPILTVDTNGMDLYDAGEEKAWLALFRRFVVDAMPVEKGRIGIIGSTPLSLSDLQASNKLKEILPGSICYGMGSGLDEVRRAASAEWNLVISPAAIGAAEYLKERFGTPYQVGFPLAGEFIPQRDFSGKRVLIIHQQVLANSLREILVQRGSDEVAAATWFDRKKTLAQPQDVYLREEDELLELVQQGGFDYIIGDSCFQPIVPAFSGQWIDIPHFAASGRMVKA